MPLSPAEQYRLHAAECLEPAERLSDPADKTRLIEIAQKFFEMASKLERSERSPK